MAETIKILGIYSPTIDTYSTLYTVPAATSAVISSLVVCNTNNFEAQVRVHTIPSGSSYDRSNALYYDFPIPANDTLAATLGITMATGDFVGIYSNQSNVNFFVFGTEMA